MQRSSYMGAAKRNSFRASKPLSLSVSDGERLVEIQAPAGHRCIWATGTGWGTFQVTAGGATLRVEHGSLAVNACTVNGRKSSPRRTVAEGEELRI